MSQGVIVGCDKNQQDLLPFFWLNFKLHNNLPLTFFDFGMDETHSAWCKSRGGYHHFPSDKNSSRKTWFLKPLAIANSPYETTLWIDIDCLIRGNLVPLFDHCQGELGIAMVKEPNDVIQDSQKRQLIPQGATMYNSGVIVVKKNSPVLPVWIEACKPSNHFRGDQEALAAALHQMQKEPNLLPDTYNWLVYGHKRVDTSSSVLHMTGPFLKQLLRMTNNLTLLEIQQSFTE